MTSWSDYVRGEYWIDESGESIFADQDIGEAGHEALAVDAMLDKEVLLDGLIERAEELELSEERLEELEWCRNDDVGASGVYFNAGYIPDEVGVEAAGSKERWQDLKKDARMAYAKHEGAILTINTSFYAWKVTVKTIQAIQSYIYEQVNDQEINDPDEELLIEEAETGRHESMAIDRFLQIKTPHQLWGGMAKWRDNPRKKKKGVTPEAVYPDQEAGMGYCQVSGCNQACASKPCPLMFAPDGSGVKLCDDCYDNAYYRQQLLLGTQVEMEHTDDPEVAEQIALEHLDEIPDYYTRLKEMERGAGVKKNPSLTLVFDTEDPATRMLRERLGDYIDFLTYKFVPAAKGYDKGKWTVTLGNELDPGKWLDELLEDLADGGLGNIEIKGNKITLRR